MKEPHGQGHIKPVTSRRTRSKNSASKRLMARLALCLFVSALICGPLAASERILVRRHLPLLRRIARDFHRTRQESVSHNHDTETFAGRLKGVFSDIYLVKSVNVRSRAESIGIRMETSQLIEVFIDSSNYQTITEEGDPRVLVGRIDYQVDSIQGSRPQSKLLYSDGSTTIYNGGSFYWFSKTLIIYIIVIAVFSFVLRNIVRGFVRGRQSKAWPTARGVILKSTWRGSMYYEGGGKHIKIEYRYTVNGEKYKSDKITVNGFGSGVSLKEAEDVKSMFPQGQEVDVFCDPSNPKDSVLIPGVLAKEYRHGIIVIICGPVLFITAMIYSFVTKELMM